MRGRANQPDASFPQSPGIILETFGNSLLTAAADLTGHFAVGALLESCLADRLAFVERTRRAIRNLIEAKVAQRRAA
jgi:hypothetical protein